MRSAHPAERILRPGERELAAAWRDLLIEHYGIGGNQIEIAGNLGEFVALITWEPPRS